MDIITRRKSVSCADFQTSLRTLEPFSISQSAFNQALLALDDETQPEFQPYSKEDEQKEMQPIVKTSLKEKVSSKFNSARNSAQKLKTKEGRSSAGDNLLNSLSKGDAAHKNAERCSKFEFVTAIFELIGTIAVAKLDDVNTDAESASVESDETATAKPPAAKSSNAGRSKPVRLLHPDGKLEKQEAVYVRLFDLDEETVSALGKGQIGSYLHKNLYKPTNRKLTAAGSTAVIGVKVFLLGAEAIKLMKAAPVLGTAAVAGAIGVKGGLHHEIKSGVEMLDDGVRVAASLPTAPMAAMEGKRKTKATIASTDEYVNGTDKIDPSLFASKDEVFKPLPPILSGDEVLMDLVKNRKTMQKSHFEKLVTQFIETPDWMDSLSIVGYNKALQQTTQSTKLKAPKTKLKWSTKLSNFFGLKSAANYYKQAWKTAIVNFKGSYKNVNRGSQNDVVAALLKIGEEMKRRADKENIDVLSPKSVQKLSKSQFMSVANAQIRANKPNFGRSKNETGKTTAGVVAGLGVAAGSAALVGSVAGAIPTVGLLLGMPIVAPGIALSAAKRIFNYGQVAAELAISKETRMQVKKEDETMKQMLQSQAGGGGEFTQTKKDQ